MADERRSGGDDRAGRTRIRGTARIGAVRGSGGVNAPPKSGVTVLTFGCRLNIVESEAMKRAAEAAGRQGVVIVNTCAVTSEASRQARQAIRRARRERPDAEIVVTGCGVEVEGARYSAMPEVTRILPNAGKTRADAFVRDLTPRRAGDAGGAADWPFLDGFDGRTRAFLQVQNGCDHACTFCVIPLGRGRSRSAPPARVVEEARRLAEAGAPEIVLTGVDLTSYGADLPEAPSLGRLVRDILRAAPGLPRLRLSSVDAIECDEALIRAFAEEERLMPHLHLSLQSGDDMILKRMKRRHARADAVALCARLRALRPDIAFGADLIAGFPTESEQAFANTLALVDDCGLTHLHVFPYSARPGTPAARMPQTPGEASKERAARLRAAGQAALTRHLDAQIGRRLSVLAERGGMGRAADFTSVATPNVAAGRIVAMRCLGHDGARLLARIEPTAHSAAAERPGSS
ncbi:MAG: tRNA (N(6)-L-threonylcarbamoyladenosine(37)-C(2))-methylthiotransferase MtaB [Rhizobiales bacterium]|nr:tRNA (N(6)-L-threonylcarbamoyladenosine(37)-C(2))-methylthiotransferase MtaB [Hyphomicrobiales bacterium]